MSDIKSNMKKKGSLSSLLKQANSGNANNVKVIDLSLIDLDPDQPRKTIAPEEIAELAASLKALGQIQPIVVRENPKTKGRFIIVVGECRYRASLLNESSNISALVKEDGDMPEDKLRLIQIAENLSRTELSSLDLVNAVSNLSSEYGLSGLAISAAIGCSQSRVSEYMIIAEAPKFIKQYLIDGAKLRPVVELARLYKLDPDFIESHLENVDVKEINMPFTNSLKSQISQLNDDTVELNADWVNDDNSDKGDDSEEPEEANTEEEPEEAKQEAKQEEELEEAKQEEELDNSQINNDYDMSDIGSAFTTRTASKAIIRVKTPVGVGVIAMVYLPTEPDTISVSLDVGSIITVPIVDVTIIGYE